MRTRATVGRAVLAENDASPIRVSLSPRVPAAAREVGSARRTVAVPVQLADPQSTPIAAIFDAESLTDRVVTESRTARTVRGDGARAVLGEAGGSVVVGAGELDAGDESWPHLIDDGVAEAGANCISASTPVVVIPGETSTC
jgi:hypothetical protein